MLMEGAIARTQETAVFKELINRQHRYCRDVAVRGHVAFVDQFS
jgi:hypothetical protein